MFPAQIFFSFYGVCLLLLFTCRRLIWKILNMNMNELTWICGQNIISLSSNSFFKACPSVTVHAVIRSGSAVKDCKDHSEQNLTLWSCPLFLFTPVHTWQKDQFQNIQKIGIVISGFQIKCKAHLKDVIMTSYYRGNALLAFCTTLMTPRYLIHRRDRRQIKILHFINIK